MFLPLFFRTTAWIPAYKLSFEDSITTDKLIVSLTCKADRIDTVWIAIESMLRQTKKPDSIILWLFEDDFAGMKSLPDNLLRLQNRGLSIRFCKENLRPHLKYFYSMAENPQATVITIDDDKIYPATLIESLIDASEKYPDTICCAMARIIKTSNGNCLSYSEWNLFNENSGPRFDLLPLGVGGVVYPPGS